MVWERCPIWGDRRAARQERARSGAGERACQEQGERGAGRQGRSWRVAGASEARPLRAPRERPPKDSSAPQGAGRTRSELDGAPRPGERPLPAGARGERHDPRRACRAIRDTWALVCALLVLSGRKARPAR